MYRLFSSPSLTSFICKGLITFTLTIVSLLWMHTSWQSIDIFGKDDCQHCQDAKQDLVPEYANYHSLSLDENETTYYRIIKKLNLPAVVPLIIVDDLVLQWYGPTQKEFLDEYIASGIASGYIMSGHLSSETTLPLLDRDLVYKDTLFGGACDLEDMWWCSTDEHNTITVPLFGTLDIEKLWLTVTSLLLWFVDGFNPCAMWVLVMFLGALIQCGSRQRMFQVAGIFILAEAIMYFLILSAWMSTWNFVGMDTYVTPFIGILALGAGSYFLYDRYTWDGTCNVWSLAQKRKVSNKVKELASQPMTRAVFLGIIVLAFSVNVFEFVCSIGIPQAFTKLLDINVASYMVKMRYMFLYIITYMIDDLIVFGIAIYSFDKIGLTTKYAKIAHLIGGILMLVLGAFMLFAPDLLIW